MDELRRFSLLTIGEVARRTGVKLVTLRAWERRYGVPRPARTPSNYRLYDVHAIYEIESMKRHLAEGLEARQAALLVRRGRVHPASTPADRRMRRWEQRLELACLRFDEPAATATIADASREIGALAALKTVVLPVVSALGDGWHDGLVSISQEHFASQIARREALAFLSSQTPHGGRRQVLAGCAPNEQHELGLLVLLCELARRGLRVVHLGSDVPAHAFLETIDRLRPGIAVVGVTVAAHLDPWRRQRQQVRQQMAHGTAFVWAGPGATDGSRGLPGHVADTLDDAAETIVGVSQPRSSRAARGAARRAPVRPARRKRAPGRGRS